LLFAKGYEVIEEYITRKENKKMNLRARKWPQKARFCEKTRDYPKIN
jgi:hypothetical protein